MSVERSPDAETAAAFAGSWNRQREGSVYTREQFLDWFTPLEPEAFAGKAVLELGFGNGSLLYHMAACRPARLSGVELGDTFERTKANLGEALASELDLHQADLTKVDLGPFDFVYCIGVLHHLKEPVDGFRAVLRHTRARGRFHCWVYAREGNAVIRYFVDPLRRVTSRLPWWLTKYGVALSIAFEEKSFDESRYARMVADEVGTEHHELTVTSSMMLTLVPKLMDFLDEPFGDSSIVPTYFLSQFTREKVKSRSVVTAAMRCSPVTQRSQPTAYTRALHRITRSPTGSPRPAGRATMLRSSYLSPSKVGRSIFPTVFGACFRKPPSPRSISTNSSSSYFPIVPIQPEL